MATVAHAQSVDRRYAEEPTGGVYLPGTPLAGEHDALTTTINPGGLPLLRGPELALALDLEDQDIATTSGPGFGIYAATPFGGEIIPRSGIGMALEWLRPSRSNLAPDPGKPFRFTLAYGLGLGKSAGLGVAWHRWSAEGALAGLTAWDVGLSWRAANYVAVGAVVRDLATRDVADTPVQRRYELEVVTRPLGTDVLDVAVGGRVGETRGDLDGWGRIVARAARGFYVIANVESDQLHALVDTPMGVVDKGGRDVRFTLGVSLSFGSASVAAYGTGQRNDLGENHALGGTVIAKVSEVGPPTVLGPTDHIERVELSGDISTRDATKLVLRLREIARDRSVKGLVVQFDGVSAGWGTVQELRGEIAHVRAAGKKVFAYMVSGSSRDYFIATAADRIYVDPAGGLRIVGMGGTTMYFRGTFDMLGVNPQFEKIAEYKSAPEQLTETTATPTAAKMREDLLDSVWSQWVDAVAAGRHLTPEQVRAIVDNGPYTAGELADDHRLVDAVAPPDKISKLITSELGGSYEVSTPPTERPERWKRPGIAIIYIDGDIVDGTSETIPLLGTKLAGGQTVIAAITAARQNDDIGAIILRINSPGGSALASELISREVFATKEVKPILCSMSDVAASGGYFAAAGCDTIFAEPMTITGSIGIFYGKFDISGLAHKLGISFDTYKRGKHADIESMYRPLTDEERAKLLEQLRYSYSRFVGAVAEGRHMSKTDVDAAGRGHVYTGEQAKPIRLVDSFGGLGDAIDEAKHRMKLAPHTKVTIVELPAPPSSLLGAAGKLLGVHDDASVVAPLARDLVRGLPASAIVAPEGALARLPYDLTFE
jgi:protease-4